MIRFRLGLVAILISVFGVVFRLLAGAWVGMTSPSAPNEQTGQIFFEQDCGREGCWHVYYVTSTQYELLKYSEIAILIGLIVGGLLMVSVTLDGKDRYARRSFR
jgi:hypothetical protein